jgi:hypothetical protein
MIRLKRKAAEVSIDDTSNIDLKPAPGKIIRIGEKASIGYHSAPYEDAGSFQPVGVDLTIDPNAGSFDTSDSDYIAPIMGNILLRDDLDAFSEEFVAVNAGDLFTITAHGLTTGDGPFELVAGSGALPSGVSAATPYWAIVVDADNIQLAASKADALAGTEVVIGSAGTAHSSRLLKSVTTYAIAEGNYLAGVIGKYNVPGEVFAQYPTGGVIGEIGEDAGFPTAKPDGAVVAVIGGDSAKVCPNAYFKVRHLNSNAGSGPSYGLDLYDEKASGLGYLQGEPSVAAIRFPNGLYLVTLDTAITANSTTTSAPAGSIGITSHATGRGKLFMSDGTKWQFAAVA